MTKGQRIALQADWWPAACRKQGWKASDRELRLRVCAWAVSLDNPSQLELVNAIKSDATPARWLESCNDLDNKEDIDRVKSCLGMLADNLKQTGEVGQPQYGSARRKRDVIRAHLKCLALFESHPKRFLASLVNDMFNHGRPGLTIRELTDDPNIRADGSEGPSELHRLLMRLAQIVNDKRAGTMSVHSMKLAAGVPCDCAQCQGSIPPILPLPPTTEDWSDFEPELETVTDEFGGDGESGDNPF